MNYLISLSLLMTMAASSSINTLTVLPDRPTIYATLNAATTAEEIDQQIESLPNEVPNLRTGYEGALLMRKAGLVSGPFNKLATFRTGRARLEKALDNGKLNPELHFLRLIIQEHAPRILNYKGNLRATKPL